MNSHFVVQNFESVSSTNTVGLEWLDQPHSDSPFQPILVLSKHQTAGRGRQGRSWIDIEEEHFNFMGSFVFQIHERWVTQMITFVPLLTGIAAMDALQASVLSLGFLDSKNPFWQDLRLKWPNDLYWRDQKWGGILCESRWRGSSCSGIVSGVGINLDQAPAVSDRPVSSIKDLCLQLKGEREGAEGRPWNSPLLYAEFLSRFKHEMSLGLQELNSGFGRRILDRWEHWAKLQAYSTLEFKDREGQNVAVQPLGLNEDGSLRARKLSGGPLLRIDQAETLS